MTVIIKTFFCTDSKELCNETEQGSWTGMTLNVQARVSICRGCSSLPNSSPPTHPCTKRYAVRLNLCLHSYARDHWKQTSPSISAQIFLKVTQHGDKNMSFFFSISPINPVTYNWRRPQCFHLDPGNSRCFTVGWWWWDHGCFSTAVRETRVNWKSDYSSLIPDDLCL